jgi:hypothetical protein
MIISFPRNKAPSEPNHPTPDHHPNAGPGPDVPLRLDTAAKLAFPYGGMTASGLRREGKRGRLVIERIAGKDFTTLRHIEEMRERCRNEQAKAPDCGSSPSATRKADVPGSPHGSSAMMVQSSSALAALERTVRGLKERASGNRGNQRDQSQPENRHGLSRLPLPAANFKT